MGTVFVGAASSGHGFMDQRVLWTRSEAAVPQRARDMGQAAGLGPPAATERMNKGAGGHVSVVRP